MSYHQLPVAVPIRPTSGLATASMIMGLIGFFGGWCLMGIPCVLAVIFGHMALKETKTGERGGHGQAIAGLVLGYILVVPGILLTIMIVVPALLGGVGVEVTPSPTPSY